MGVLQNMGRPSGLPYSLLSQAIHRLTRAELEDLAQSLIDHMDGIDGDPDLEEVDEREPDREEGELAWPEDGSPMGPTGTGIFGMTEDDEDDDPTGQSDEDGANTGDGRLWLHGKLLSGPGCLISDDDREEGGTMPLHYMQQPKHPADSWDSK